MTTSRDRRGVLPLLALLFFMNSAVCYCMSFSHDHDHGTDLESPAPHDCDCLTVVDPLPADTQVDLDAPALVLAVVELESLLESADGAIRPVRDVRPPGEHAPPSPELLCTYLC